MSKTWRTQQIAVEAPSTYVYGAGVRGLARHFFDVLLRRKSGVRLVVKLHTRGTVEIARAELVRG